MQKFIAKYGVAAHLAILAVAPLFLFPFVDAGTLANVLLWLAVPAATWSFLEPSLRSGERLHDARRRMLWHVLRDPLFWASIVLVVFTALRAFNDGVRMSYDAEGGKWFIAEAIFPILPASVGRAGYLPFTASVAAAVMLMGCRHSLGRSARMAFLLMSSMLAGLAALVSIFALYFDEKLILDAIASSSGALSFIGFAYGLYLLGGTVSLIAAFEHKWNFAMLLFPLSIGCTAAGVFAFSPIYISGAMGIFEIIMLIYSFAFASRKLRAAGEFKFLVVVGISITLGGLCIVALYPETQLTEKLAAYTALQFLPDGFWEHRAVLSAVALKSWLSHLWIGTGLESFSLDFRFNATPEDWNAMPHGATAMTNGWWQTLAERGVIGCVFFVLPFGFLLFSYFRRLVEICREFAFPHPACLLMPLAFAAFVAVGFFDCTLMRVDVLMALGALMAISALSFQRRG